MTVRRSAADYNDRLEMRYFVCLDNNLVLASTFYHLFLITINEIISHGGLLLLYLYVHGHLSFKIV